MKTILLPLNANPTSEYSRIATFTTVKLSAASTREGFLSHFLAFPLSPYLIVKGIQIAGKDVLAPLMASQSTRLPLMALTDKRMILGRSPDLLVQKGALVEVTIQNIDPRGTVTLSLVACLEGDDV
jgi:hypothetical protein